MKNLILASAVLVGCYDEYTEHQCDRALQTDIFLKCLSVVPTGPLSLTDTDNDWDDVVSECRYSASQIACTNIHIRQHWNGKVEKIGP